MRGRQIEIGGALYTFEPYIAVRTPLVNFSQFGDWLKQDAFYQPEVESESAALADLRERLNSPEVMEAIQTASPSLYERLLTWEPKRNDPRSRKLRNALIRYFSRIAYRCTPFGLCAGLSWGSYEIALPDEAQKIVLGEQTEYRRHARLDMGIIAALANRATNTQEAFAAVRYESNPTLHLRGKTWDFIETKFHDGRPRFELSFVDNSEHLERLLEFVDRRPEMPTYSELRTFLGSVDSDVLPAEVDDYLNDLVTSGVLVSDLMPKLTADVGTHSNADAFLHKSIPFAEQVQHIDALLSALNEQKIGTAATSINAVTEAILQLEPRTKAGALFQTDLTKPLRSATLATETFEAVGDAARFVMAFPRFRFPQVDKFVRAFVARYGEMQMPLLEVLDPDNGIGFGEGVSENSTQGPSELPESTQDFLMRRYEKACRSASPEILISKADLEELKVGSENYASPSIFVLATLIKDQQNAGKSVAVLRSVVDRPCTRYLARFANYDARLAAWLRELAGKETSFDEDDAIHAEIIYWPTNRLGNVLQRPLLRSHEIAIHGRFGVEKQQRIYLRDIMVSIQGSRIDLRCRKSRRRIVPWLTNAHNFAANGNLPVYRFLCSLQGHENGLPSFRWPRILTGAAELPRIRFGDCIVSPRTWTLRAWELKQLKSESFERSQATVARWSREKNWPKIVELVDFDNRIPFDLESHHSLECLTEELRGREQATIHESYAGDLDLVVNGSGGFCNETAFVLVRNDVTAANRIADKIDRQVILTSQPSRTHTFLPGGPPWISAKLYAGPARVDLIIANQLRSLLDSLAKKLPSTKLFFVRYSDPHFHLRLRVRAEAGDWNCALEAVHGLFEELQRGQHVWRCEIAGYEREVERYGGEHMVDMAEKVFFLDSKFAVSLAAQADCWSETVRCKWTLQSIDSLWRSAGLSPEARAHIYKSLAAQLTQRLGRGKAGKIAMDLKFRRERKDFCEFLAAAPGSSSDHPLACHAALGERNRCVDDFVRHFGAIGPDRSARRLETVVESFAHMTVNRIARDRNLEAEWMAYEILSRIAESEQARSREKKRADRPGNVWA